MLGWTRPESARVEQFGWVYAASGQPFLMLGVARFQLIFAFADHFGVVPFGYCGISAAL